MRHAVIALALVSLLIGCSDEQALKNAQVEQQYNQAMAALAEAEAGYIPGAAGAKPEALELQTYRQKKLAEAADQIQGVMTQGSPAQQIAARRLLANIYAAQARHTARLAVTQWTALVNRSATLMSQLVAVDRAQGRANLFSIDESPLMNELQKNQGDLAGRIAELEKNAQQRRSQIDAAKGQIAKLTEQKNQTAAQAQQLRDKAFTLKAQEQYDTYTQAAETQRKAEMAGAQAEQLQVRTDVQAAELAILDRQLELTREAVKALDAQVKAGQDRQQDMAKQRDQALAEKAKAAQQLLEQLQDISQAYRDQVMQPLAQAQEQIERAIQNLQGAVQMAQGRDRDSVRLDLLLKQVTKTHILSQQVMVSGAFADLLGALSAQAPRLMAEQAQMLKDNAQKLAQDRDALTTEATKVISDASGLATELGQGRGDNDPIGSIVNQQIQHLQSYMRGLSPRA